MRTEEEILKDFEQLGYKVNIRKEFITLYKDYECDKNFVDADPRLVCRISNKEEMIIDRETHKIEKRVDKVLDPYQLTIRVSTSSEITLLEFKILQELFKCWGWL